MSILRRAKGTSANILLFWCPGCDTCHQVWVGPPGGWEFNGDHLKPTFKPSLMVNAGRANPGRPQCHSHITDGRIEFLADCTHSLGGNTVDIPEWPRPDFGGVEEIP